MSKKRSAADEERNLILDRPMAGKSTEELKKHSVDATYENKPIERALYILTKGDDVQKLSIIQALPQLVRIDQQATFSRIVPKIQQELPKASSEFQVTTSQIFRVLIEKEIPINLLGAVVQGVDSRDPVVSSAWMETLLAVIPLLTEQVLKNEIIPLIVIKSQLSQPVGQRVAASRIIGKIANHRHLKPTDVKKDILPFVHGLCQDSIVEVRAFICMQLPAVAEGIGAGYFKTQLLPCFVELASDNSVLVREAAVLTIVEMFAYLDRETVEGTMVPLIRKFCEKIVPEDNISTIIASQIGAIMKNIVACLSNDEKIWFLGFYKKLSHKGFEIRPNVMQNVDASKDVMCRDNCAANLPEMAKFVSTALPQQMDMLYSIFRDLAADPCYIVRRSVAGCLHEVANVLGSQNRMLKTDFVRLLRDDAEDVLQMLVPNVNKTLLLMAEYGLLSKDRTDQCTMEISRAMLKCQIELCKGYNWRLLTTFLEQLECLPKCMPCEFIHQHFTPMVLSNAANGRAKPIRYQATRTLLLFLRYNNKENQQKWLRDALVSQFCYSDSCYTRQIFVKICVYAIDIFSSKYFKQHFFMPLVGLADDPISNVRYSFITILPKLKLITLIQPSDTKYKVLLQDAISKLEMREKDKFVQDHLKRVGKELQNTNLTTNKEFQAQDQRKLEEESRSSQQEAEKPLTITANQGMKPKAPPAPAPNKPRAPTNGPTEPQKAPAKPAPAPADMNFLEQHFYIDAGVNLPDALSSDEELEMSAANELKGVKIRKKHVRAKAKQKAPSLSMKMPVLLSSGLSENELRIIESSTANMTDDVKVNLRKLKKNKLGTGDPLRASSCSSIPRFSGCSNIDENKSKRHSSVFPTTCSNDKEKKLLNRRSLNISSQEVSKIPVSAKKDTIKTEIAKVLKQGELLRANSIRRIRPFGLSENTKRPSTPMNVDANIKKSSSKSTGIKVYGKAMCNEETTGTSKTIKNLKSKYNQVCNSTVKNCDVEVVESSDRLRSSGERNTEIVDKDATFENENDENLYNVSNNVNQRKCPDQNRSASVIEGADSMDKSTVSKTTNLPVAIRRTQK